MTDGDCGTGKADMPEPSISERAENASSQDADLSLSDRLRAEISDEGS